MNDTAIRVRDLRKHYGEVAALDGVDLDIARGEVFALLGPNGAGKTTAVEIMEGHRDRDGGEVAVLGSDPAAGRRRWRARIGIVVQGAKDTPELTVSEWVRVTSRYYPNPHDPGAVLDLVGLTDKADTRVRGLSGGQRRRLDVALGIVGDPELLFLDEPTTGFDPEARQQFWSLISELAAGGTTILLTTHYLEEAETLADRLGVIAGGRIVALGPPATVGGRTDRRARVNWRSPEGPQSVHTATPTTVVTELAQEYGGEVPDLTVSRPSLEDVYFSLIRNPDGAGADHDGQRP